MQRESAAVVAGRDAARLLKSPSLRSLPSHSAHQHGTCAEVAISMLRPADSPRLSGEDEEHIRRLAETESVLLPIIVHRRTMRVVDGMHRLHAARLKGQDTILVEFFEGSEDDAFLRAVQLNTAHGLPLTLADRRAAAARIVTTHPELSDRSIAAYCGITAKTVAALRCSTGDSPQLNARRGGDGRIRPLDPNAGRRRAAEVIIARPDASLREIAKEAGISPATAKDVRDRMRRGDAPVRPRTERRVAGTGTAPPRAPDRLTRVPDGARTDVSAVLGRLRRDPALRLSESGRDLLRVLHSHTAGFEELTSLVKVAPPHCLDTLVILARRIAEEWQDVECAIKQRRQAP